MSSTPSIHSNLATFFIAAYMVEYQLSIVRLNDGRWMCGQFGDGVRGVGKGWMDDETGDVDGRILNHAVADTVGEAIVQSVKNIQESAKQ